jgi:coproporphyrinogen III oxidase-like Fe-S oxidoreductase
MGLRLREGVDITRLLARTGYAPGPAQAALLEEQGLLARDGDRIKVSRRGNLVLNTVAAALATALERH